MFYIYGIVDPITSEIRYVGYTSKKPTRRLIGHLTEEGKGDKAQWINDLLDDGLLPSVVTLQKAETEHEARLIERWWIYQGQISRWPLLNELHAVKPAAPKISRVFNEAEPRYIPENNKTEGPGRRPKWQEFAADWRVDTVKRTRRDNVISHATYL